MSVQKNDDNILRTNPNCNIVQDSTDSVYYTIIIYSTAKGKNNKIYQEITHKKMCESKFDIPDIT